MKDFRWSPRTEVIFGLGRFSSVHKRVRGLGKRALIITSPSFLSGGALAGILEELKAQLGKIGVEHQVFGKVEPNPRTTTVDQAAALARDFRPRYVLALGGGSVMDAAKAVALLAVNPGNIYDYAYRGTGRPMLPFHHALPVVCIPTIAATGSETDFYAVVTEPAAHRKVTVFGEALYPTLAIIDPELTYSVPAAQTVEGAFDIITHVTESYLSTAEPAPFQDGLTESVVKTVVWALPRVLADPRDAEARAQLSWSAAFALSGAFSGREGGWPVHALEHGISAWNDLPHGRGLAVLLPRVMAFDAQTAPEKILRFNRAVFGVQEGDPVTALSTGLIKYMREVGAWRTIQLGDLAESVIDHALETNGVWKTGQEPYLENIRPVHRADARAILKACESEEISPLAIN